MAIWTGYPAEPDTETNVAGVGLFVPFSWEKRPVFEQRFCKLKPRNWGYIEELDPAKKAELDENYRFWVALPYTKFVRGGKFDMQRFLAAIVRNTTKAIALKPAIDKILSGLG